MVQVFALVAVACALGAAGATTEQLQKITQGKVSKSEVELVLAHFNEDASWSDPFASIRTVYCKGTQMSSGWGCEPLENVGREGHTYLHHIVTNYDNLAEWTVFSQAGEPTVGYNGHRMGGGHMQPGVNFTDYLVPKEGADSFFVFTGALHVPSLFHAIRSSYLFPPESLKEQLEVGSQCPKASSSDRWERLDLPKWFQSMLSSKCGFLAGGMQEHLEKYWQDHIKTDMPDDGMVFFAQGARFAVSRDRIRQRPREEYEDLLKLLSTSKDPCQNYLNEWLWYYIMGKPATAPCATGDIDTEAPGSASVRFLSGHSGTTTTSGSSGTTTASATTTASSGNATASSGNATTTTLLATSAAHSLGASLAALAAVWVALLVVQ